MQIRILDYDHGNKVVVEFVGEAAKWLYWLTFRDLAIRNALLAVSDGLHADKSKEVIDTLRIEMEKTRINQAGIFDPTLR